jgi:hypothetical protein
MKAWLAKARKDNWARQHDISVAMDHIFFDWWPIDSKHHQAALDSGSWTPHEVS